MTNATGTGTASSRRIFIGLWTAAAVGYTALLLLGRTIAAVGAFVGFGALAIAYQYVSDVRFDERDTAIYETASARTIQVVGTVSAVLFPSLIVATSVGYYEWSPFMGGVGATVGVVFAVWVLLVGLARLRR